MSHPTSTYLVRGEHFQITATGEHAIRYIANVPASFGESHFFYIPANPVALGDAITLFSRVKNRHLIISFSENKNEDKKGTPFISIVLRPNTYTNNLQIIVSLGGVDRFSQILKSYNFSIVFDNGSTIHVNDLDARSYSIHQWPSQIPLENANMFASGYTLDSNNKKITLNETTYSIVPADEVFVGKYKAYAERNINYITDITNNIFLGGTFILPLNFTYIVKF